MSKHNKGNGIYFETENTTGLIFNKAFIPTGRIKRMRTYLPFSAKHTNIRPFRKRMGEKAYTRIVLDFSFRRPPITRWNRH